MKYSHIAVQPLLGYRYKVIKPIYYKDVEVHIGYRTNGADIPKILWWYIPPYWSDALPAVIVHDYMCDKATKKEDYEKADKYFAEILRKMNVQECKREQIINAVVFYTQYVRKYKG